MIYHSVPIITRASKNFMIACTVYIHITIHGYLFYSVKLDNLINSHDRHEYFFLNLYQVLNMLYRMTSIYDTLDENSQKNLENSIEIISDVAEELQSMLYP